MKRKLDQDNVPAPETWASASQTEPGFKSFGLDSRLLHATVKEEFNAPTPVQSRAIPLALEGKDIIGDYYHPNLSELLAKDSHPVRAKTGSGKTAAYLLPLLELILRRKNVGTISALLLGFAHPCYRTVQLRKAQLPSYLFLPTSWPNKPQRSWLRLPHSATETYVPSISLKRYPTPYNDHCWQTPLI